jgi:ribose 5-phosphate isomerase RpiB
MNANGQAKDGGTLHWSGRIVTAEDLRQRLNGEIEIALPERAIITPLAAEHLADRGVRVVRQKEPRTAPADVKGSWGIAQQRLLPLVEAAASSLKREGVSLEELAREQSLPTCRWAALLAKGVASTQHAGVIVFCEDPGLVCCVANKFKGIRGAVVHTPSQAARAVSTLGVNFAAIEMPGRTLFELRQILRSICSPRSVGCPEPVASTLKELDGDAHR